MRAAKAQAASLRLLVEPLLLRRLKKDVTQTRPEDQDEDGGGGGGGGERRGRPGGGAFAQFARGGSAGGGGGGDSGREMGDNVARLPPKTEQVLFCRLSRAQRALYEQVRIFHLPMRFIPLLAAPPSPLLYLSRTSLLELLSGD